MRRAGLLLEAFVWLMLLAVLGVQAYNQHQLHLRLAAVEELAGAEVVVAPDGVRVRASR